MTKPILRWPGSKRRHLKTLLPLISPHVCYVEPFAGSLALLLAKDRSPVEIVNDTHREVVALYRCAQFHPDALAEEFRWLLSARANFTDFKENRGLTDLQRAARFLLLNKTSFAGNNVNFGVQKNPGGGAVFCRERMIARLVALRTRMHGVVVECLDWERCVDLYDSKDAFFFFDPPYLNSEISAYAGWNEAQMTHLRDRLKALKGGWLLTVDGSDFCKKLFARWNCREVTTRCQAVNNRVAQKTFKELFITPE